MPPEIYGPAGALAVFAFVVIGFIRGDIVPGWIYKLEQAQRMKAEAEAERNAEALAVLAKVAANGKSGPHASHAGAPSDG